MLLPLLVVLLLLLLLLSLLLLHKALGLHCLTVSFHGQRHERRRSGRAAA